MMVSQPTTRQRSLFQCVSAWSSWPLAQGWRRRNHGQAIASSPMSATLSALANGFAAVICSETVE
ncbi:MAG: hypothetical protein V2J89_17615 [Halieaceae bacterium]|jgi:hypothetical protein|nr:hypothetical protein [Halieaceae bacterium]